MATRGLPLPPEKVTLVRKGAGPGPTALRNSQKVMVICREVR